PYAMHHPTTLHFYFFFFLMLRPPPSSTLFPYTTLFRSVLTAALAHLDSALTYLTETDTAAVSLLNAAKVTRGRVLVDLGQFAQRSEEHTSELQSRGHLVCRLLLEKKKRIHTHTTLQQHR